MNQPSIDLFYQFTDEYEKGEILKALQLILSNPDIHYGDLTSKETSFDSLVNYTDAVVFKGVIECYTMNVVLQKLIDNDEKLKQLMLPFQEVLKDEQKLISYYFLNEEERRHFRELGTEEMQAFAALVDKEDKLNESEVEYLGERLPPLLQSSLKRHFKMAVGWQHFVKAKPGLAKVITSHPESYKTPWHGFAYKLPLEPRSLSEGNIPLIFLEPLDQVDYESFLSPFIDDEAIFVFETSMHLAQALYFKEIQKSLTLPHHHVYLLNIYPHEQFAVQNLQWSEANSLKPILTTQRLPFEQVMPLLKETLEQCLKQPKENLERDTFEGNKLYQIAKRLLYRIQAERYGRNRIISLKMEGGFQEWYDVHKGRLPPNIDLGPLPKDEWKTIIEELAAKRKARPFAPKMKVRLAHIVPQIVDGGHAPSRLLRNLVFLADKRWFNLFVISTERLVERALNYPRLNYLSSPSTERAGRTLKEFATTGISFFIETSFTNYEQTAQYVANLLKKQEIDIAVFHGPDEINILCANMCDVPIRILFEHGTVPKYPGFDLAILSSEEVFQSERANLRKIGTESCALPFSIDIRESWSAKPFSKEELGFPAQSFIMTTISNHLESRLSSEMCHAIGQILQRSPQTYYAPIGPVANETKMRQIFAQYDVNERVKFLGSKPHPSHYARSMELYLNEFPFGSCLGMLDAMAAGCPVVSMYDEHGPPQARYGGVFFGMDYVITSGNVEDYVNLTCRLIQDPVFYKEWSEHAKRQYEKRVNVQQYVKTFEKIIEKFIEYHQKQKSK